MTAPALDDRSFLTDSRPYLNSRQAALYCGYTPTPGLHVLADPEMVKFYGWAARCGLHQQPGRRVYRRDELDAAIRGTQKTPTPHSLEAMRRLAESDVADRRRRARLQLKRLDTRKDDSDA